MTRFKLTLEYDGTPFVGWQRQGAGDSVQGALEAAVETIEGAHRLVQGAGRTDAGVHALGQVAHVDIEKDLTAFQIREAINFHLKPAPIVVLSAEPAADDFHARFSATERRYLYRILNRRPPPTLDRSQVWHVGRALDADAMHAAAQALIGKHDFTSFRAAECQADSPVKTLTDIKIARFGDEIELTCRAPSFLHHQVRNFVGSLEMVGAGRKPPNWIAKILAARDRTKAGPTAPACGLYLERVVY
jgi:tRNA pseudouridine38-40 synthase